MNRFPCWGLSGPLRCKLSCTRGALYYISISASQQPSALATTLWFHQNDAIYVLHISLSILFGANRRDTVRPG